MNIINCAIDIIKYLLANPWHLLHGQELQYLVSLSVCFKSIGNTADFIAPTKYLCVQTASFYIFYIGIYF